MRASFLGELCLVASLLYLAISLPLTATEPEGTCSNASFLKDKESQQQFIVRFNEYQDASYWRKQVEAALQGNSLVWEWVERQNAAASFPTDFGVIRLTHEASHHIKAQKRKLLKINEGDCHAFRSCCSMQLLSKTSIPTKCCGAH